MSEKKRKPGRPRVRPLKPVTPRCELSPEEHEQAVKAAEACGESLGVFIRRAIVEASRKALKS